MPSASIIVSLLDDVASLKRLIARQEEQLALKWTVKHNVILYAPDKPRAVIQMYDANGSFMDERWQAIMKRDMLTVLPFIPMWRDDIVSYTADNLASYIQGAINRSLVNDG
jgi:hypothetical protein